MAGPWLYSIAAKAEKVFDFEGKRQAIPVTADTYARLVETGRIVDDPLWSIIRNWKSIEIGDQVFIYTGDRDLGIIGFATVADLFSHDGDWRIRMAFDLPKCRALLRSPIPAPVVRKWVHYPRGNVISLQPFRAELDSRLPWRSNARSRETHHVKFKVGQCYSRKQIGSLLGGNLQSYLPIAGGRVVAGCFRPDLNPRAPDVVIVGTGPGIEAAAAALAKQQTPIPVFMKVGSASWEYAGKFRVNRWLRDSAAVEKYTVGAERDDATSIILLAPTVPGQVYRGASKEELASREGRVLYAMHRRRERSRQLAVAARAAARRRRHFRCEVCGFDFQALPDGLGEACCEVHHRNPIALGPERQTKVSDLALLCSNCHRIIHRTDPLMTPAELRGHLTNGA